VPVPVTLRQKNPDTGKKTRKMLPDGVYSVLPEDALDTSLWSVARRVQGFLANVANMLRASGSDYTQLRLQALQVTYTDFLSSTPYIVVSVTVLGCRRVVSWQESPLGGAW
jgi:hypothetical protein